jgi:hypothetical protein
MSRRLRILARFALALCLLAGVAASPLSPISRTVAQSGALPAAHLGYGVHIGPHTNVNPALVDQLGMDWVKVYEPGQIADFPGKRVLFRMDLSWPGNWTDFRNDVTRRANELSAFGVDAIEVHNEPNLSMEWSKGPNAWEYTQMLRVVYTQIKAVNPSIIVVSGGLAPTLTTADRGAVSDIDFAAEMLDNGAAQWFDAFGYHPYGYNQPPETEPSYDTLVFRRVELIRQLFEERGIYDKQIWLTEFGWLRDPAEDGVQCSDSDPNFAGFAWLRVSGQTQADYTVRAYQWADEHWPWAGPMFLWNLNWALYPPETNALCSHMRWFSLLRADGSPTVTFQRVASMPRRVSDYAPSLGVHAQEMTGEASMFCPISLRVGSFEVINAGYPGTRFTAEVQAVASPTGPPIEVYPPTVQSGETVVVYANTTGLGPGQYLVYINVTASINGDLVSQMVQGSVVINDVQGPC